MCLKSYATVNTIKFGAFLLSPQKATYSLAVTTHFLTAPVAAAAAQSLQLCPALRSPVDCSLTGSSVHGILQQEYWSRLPCSPPGDLPDPEIKPRPSALQADSLPLSPQESPTTLVLGEQSSTCYINLFPTLHLNGTM